MLHRRCAVAGDTDLYGARGGSAYDTLKLSVIANTATTKEARAKLANRHCPVTDYGSHISLSCTAYIEAVDLGVAP